METIVETSVWKVDCSEVTKEDLEYLSKEVLALGFDDVCATNPDENGMAIFVRRTINASDEVDFAALEQPLLKLREAIKDKDWFEDMLDAEVRHDIIGLDLENLQVVTKQYHFDIEDGLDAITSL